MYFKVTYYNLIYPNISLPSRLIPEGPNFTLIIIAGRGLETPPPAQLIQLSFSCCQMPIF